MSIKEDKVKLLRNVDIFSRLREYGLDFIARSMRSVAAFAEEDLILLKFPAAGQIPKEIFKKHPYLFANILYRMLGIISERIWNINRLIQDKNGWLQDLRRQLHRDKITGLYNRIFLREDFVNLLPEIGESAALLMIKPDNFKEINDRYGHEAGDQALNLMAIFLQSELLENDIGVRYGGDEFSILLPETDIQKAMEIGGEIRVAVENFNFSKHFRGKSVPITTSIGISNFPETASTMDEFKQKADASLYRAKHAGKNRVEWE